MLVCEEEGGRAGAGVCEARRAAAEGGAVSTGGAGAQNRGQGREQERGSRAIPSGAASAGAAQTLGTAGRWELHPGTEPLDHRVVGRVWGRRRGARQKGRVGAALETAVWWELHPDTGPLYHRAMGRV